MASQDSVKPPNFPLIVGEFLMLNKFARVKNEQIGHAFYHGTFEGKVEVFVRRIEKVRVSAQKEVEREHVAHLLTGVHKNIIRYYDDQKDNEFYYIVTEWCLLSVEDLFFPIITGNETDENKKEDNRVLEKIRSKMLKSLSSKDILRQATEGLVFLHSFNFVHRNLKPSNVLIAQDKRNPEKYVVKLSDFRTAKNLQDEKEQEHSGPSGSDGWIAPYPETEGAKKIQTDSKEDVFILGCLYYYVLDPKHHHPFGNSLDRIKNIKEKNYKVNWDPFQTSSKNQAIAIIKDMIQYDPKKRPDIKTILDRAYFLPEDYYKLYDVPNQIPGLCVIFNQEKFDNKAANRKGSGKDKEALTKIFEEFGFHCEHHDNLKANEITNQINQLAKRDNYENYGCLVVCIFSHGGDGYIFGRDDQKVFIEEEKKKFKNRKTLVGKPKIWIIQACQGDELQENQQSSILKQILDNGYRTLSSLGTDLVNWIASSITNRPIAGSDSNTQRSQQESKIISDIPRPPMSDFLDIRATIPGYVSFRDPEEGSLLIQNLCKQMREEFLDDDKSNHHLENILKKVQKTISVEDSWLPVSNKDKENYNDLLKRRNPYEIEWKPVTKEDIGENSRIELGFKKTYDDDKNKWIFKRPHKQTIEWRSTLMDFIRFEDTWLLVNEEDEVGYKDLLKRRYYNGIKWEQVTKEDMKNLKIDPIFHSQFRKTYDDQTKKWIFQRSCKQTIER